MCRDNLRTPCSAIASREEGPQTDLRQIGVELKAAQSFASGFEMGECHRAAGVDPDWFLVLVFRAIRERYPATHCILQAGLG